MLKRWIHFLELIRFSHTLFALPFALFSAVMAWVAGVHGDPPRHFRWRELLGILLAMVTARSAAMAFNRLADRHLDAQNPRTRGRHLPAGLLDPRSVAWLTMVSSAGFAASTLLFWPNRLPLYLSLPVLAFLFGYSYSKRFTAWCHVWLGAALMFAPISTWIAIRGQQVVRHPADLIPAMVLGAAVLAWVTGFDMIYACQDVEFDRKLRLHSAASRWGVPAALRLAALCHLGTVALLAALPFVYPHFGALYWCGLGVVALLLVYEHSIVRPDDLTRVNVAFFQVNAVLSLGLLAAGTLDLLL
jgi:4-hydroxybenzoate polyprenyltransferase